MSLSDTPDSIPIWRLRSTITKSAKKGIDDKVFIQPFDTGKIYTSTCIAVGINVSNSKDNWSYAGYLGQEYKFNNFGYKQNYKAFKLTRDLLINNVTIITFPLLFNNQYRLRYFPPTYFLKVKIQIWEGVFPTETTP